MRSVLFAILAAALFVASAPLPARAAATPAFTQAERQVILSYYRQLAGAGTHPAHHNRQHHAHAKDLPPGIAKNLQRGKPLPPGIAMHRLPAALTTRLPPPPRGCERIVLDGRVLLVDIATRVIHDVLADAVIRD